jgi:hypothetical protein
MEKTDSEQSPSTSSKERTKTSRALQRQQQAYDDEDDSDLEEFLAPRRKNRRMVPVHQSRISDRPIKKGAEDSSLKIKIELDLEVEVRTLPSTALHFSPFNAQECR